LSLLGWLDKDPTNNPLLLTSAGIYVLIKKDDGLLFRFANSAEKVPTFMLKIEQN
jgi:hypothetical protein